MTVAGREAAAEQQGPVSARTQNPAAVSRRNPSRGGRVPSTRRPMGARAAALQPIRARADSTPWPSAAGGRGRVCACADRAAGGVRAPALLSVWIEN